MIKNKKLSDLAEIEKKELEAALLCISNKEQIRVMVIDSGLGGLSVCKGIEKGLLAGSLYKQVNIDYLNVAVLPTLGYNGLSKYAHKIALFDETLKKAAKLTPDVILIACNTLSVLLADTSFIADSHPPTISIVGFGVQMILGELLKDEDASAIIFGTETTIESDAHRQFLLNHGIADGRIIPQSCPGLQGMIEHNSDVDIYPEIRNFIKEAMHSKTGLSKEQTIVGAFCCSHYGYKSKLFRKTFDELGFTKVVLCDPNQGMSASLQAQNKGVNESVCDILITVRSRYVLDLQQKQLLSGLLGEGNRVTKALQSAIYDKNLFNINVLERDAFGSDYVNLFL